MWLSSLSPRSPEGFVRLVVFFMEDHVALLVHTRDFSVNRLLHMLSFVNGASTSPHNLRHDGSLVDSRDLLAEHDSQRWLLGDLFGGRLRRIERLSLYE